MEHGKWKVEYLPITKQPAVYAGDELIAAGVTEANARLIAAAPMLYEALKGIEASVVCNDDMSITYAIDGTLKSQIRQALSKVDNASTL